MTDTLILKRISSSLFKSCVRKTSSYNCGSLSKTSTIKMNQHNNFNDKLYPKFRDINSFVNCIVPTHRFYFALLKYEAVFKNNDLPPKASYRHVKGLETFSILILKAPWSII